MSILCNSSKHLLIIIVRWPQANMEAKKPAISISCFFEKRCGMEIGSFAIKSTALYSCTLRFKKCNNLLFTQAKLRTRLLCIMKCAFQEFLNFSQFRQALLYWENAPTPQNQLYEKVLSLARYGQKCIRAKFVFSTFGIR